MSGRLGTWDADIYFTVTERLLTRGRLDVPRSLILSHEEWKGRGGLYYAPFDLGQSIVTIPFYLAGKGIGGVVAGGRSESLRDLITRSAVSTANALFTVLTVWVVWALARDLGFNRRGRTGSALFYGLATMAWPYATIGFNQPLATLGQTIGLWGTLRFVRSRSQGDGLLAGCGAALGMFARLNTILAVPWFALAMLLAIRGTRPTGQKPRSRTLRSALAFVVPIALAFIAAMAYNYARFESVWRSGYAGDANAEFHLRFVPRQFLALLVSPSKGVVFYVPITLLAFIGGIVWRKAKDRNGGANKDGLETGSRFSFSCVPWLFGGIALSYLLFFSAMAYGHSGVFSWGPRFFVPLMPLIGVLAWVGYEWVRPDKWGAAIGKTLVAVSLAIQALAVTSDQGERVVAVQRRLGDADFYEESFFTFRGNLIVDRARSVGEKAASLFYGPAPSGTDSLVPRDRPSEKSLVLAYSACPDFWWAYATAMGLLPWGALSALLAVGLAIAVVLVRKVRNDLAADSSSSPVTETTSGGPDTTAPA